MVIEMRQIRKIDSAVLNVLQSQITITDVTDVVKELLENSIDSHATDVVLKLRTDDFYQIWCKDNGTGVTPDDLNNIGKRSYTSKLPSANLESLRDVQTFGFRGEALHSIINLCSRSEIITKPRNYGSNYKATFDKGKRLKEIQILDEADRIHKMSGTTVVASNIFGTLPVRLAHLQKISDLSIINKIRSIVFGLSIFSPEVRIKIFKTDSLGNESLVIYAGGYPCDKNVFVESLRANYGLSIAGSFEYFEAEYKEYKLSGVIALKTVSDKAYQSIFLNKRRVLNTKLMKSINKLFANSGFNDQGEILLPNFSNKQLSPRKGKSPTKMVGKPFSKHPVFVFNVKCPLSVSDLTQDPAKVIYESDHFEIIEVLIARLVRKFFKSRGYSIKGKGKSDDRVFDTPQYGEQIKIPEMRLFVNTKCKSSKNLEDYAKTISPLDQYIPRKINFNALKFPQRYGCQQKHSCNHEIEKISQIEEKSHFFPGISQVQLSRFDLEKISVIGQVDQKFILIKINQIENRAVLLVIDQHACDERIRVECLLKEFVENSILETMQQKQFAVLTSLKFEVSYRDLGMLEEFCQSFSILGIQFQLSSNIVEVTRLPTILADKVEKDNSFMKNVLLEHCYDLKSGLKFKTTTKISCDWWGLVHYLPRIVIDLINSKACRSSIMFGDDLTRAQCEEYILKLISCKRPFQCAHGRPSIVPLLDLNSVYN